MILASCVVIFNQLTVSLSKPELFEDYMSTQAGLKTARVKIY